MTDALGTIFIVDDDEAIRGGLSLLLRSYRYRAESFASGRSFLARCEQPMPERCMAILDLSMPGMDGLAVQEELRQRGLDVPIVFLSGDGNIPVAVTAVQHGAVDFVEKPVNSDVLISTIERALALCGERSEAPAQNGIRTRFESLTPRERQVLESIAGGKTSRTMASDLGISERTVELHRSRVLKKMGVRNSTELLKRVIPNIHAWEDGRK